MSARILEGKHIAAALRKEIKAEVDELRQLGIVPALAMIRVGQDPASLIYMNAKARASAEVGMQSTIMELPADSSEERIRIVLEEIAQNTSIHGVIVQLPLPRHLDTPKILSLMSPEKDVDGFHPINAGRLSMGEPIFVPATPMGIKELLDKSGISVDGAHVVIIGRSNIVGRPLANYLSIKRPGLNATVTICHSSTKNLEKTTRYADILVSAMGRAEFVGSSMVSPGTVVVDVGMNRIVDCSSPSGTSLVGDVKFDEVREVASAITPVPGGVGPMTVAMLLKNTIRACRMQTRT